MSSYFLTSVLHEDLKGHVELNQRNIEMLKKQYPIGWMYFSPENIEALLKQLQKEGIETSFAEMQLGMKKLYNIYGIEDDREESHVKKIVNTMNEKFILQLLQRKQRELKRAKYYSGYVRNPRQGAPMPLPVNVNIRDRNVKAHYTKHDGITLQPTPAFRNRGSALPFLPLPAVVSSS